MSGFGGRMGTWFRVFDLTGLTVLGFGLFRSKGVRFQGLGSRP